jgi:hypothetical protein
MSWQFMVTHMPGLRRAAEAVEAALRAELARQGYTPGSVRAVMGAMRLLSWARRSPAARARLPAHRASPARAASKGHKTFISRTAPHHEAATYITPLLPCS